MDQSIDNRNDEERETKKRKLFHYIRTDFSLDEVQAVQKIHNHPNVTNNTFDNTKYSIIRNNGTNGQYLYIPLEDYKFRDEMETKFPRREYENVIRYITSKEYVPKSIHQ